MSTYPSTTCSTASATAWAGAAGGLRELDARWSRFRPDSDVGRLNLAAGSPVPMVVAQETLVLLDHLVEAWRATGGAWRAVHLTSYVTVWLVSIHAGLAGTDTTNVAYRGVAVVLTVAALVAALVRLNTPTPRGRPAAAPGNPAGLRPRSPTPRPRRRSPSRTAAPTGGGR